MKSEIKPMDNENKNVAPKRKAYVKPMVGKHETVTLVTGSGCGQYVSVPPGVYYY
jgi:hypothetical protein